MATLACLDPPSRYCASSQLTGTTVKLTASDGHKWRIERLEKARRLIEQSLGIDADNIIAGMSDHDDALIVYWRRDFTQRDERAVDGAWRTLGASIVVHAVENRARVDAR